MHRNKLLYLIFWLFTLAAVGLIGWKFFGSQDQPMETKILFVFLTFVVSAVLFRFIRKKGQEDEKLEKWTAEAIEWSDTGISAVLLAFLIMAFLVQAFKIPSGSMQPTLKIGDHLFVNKFIYGTQVPFTLKKLWTLKEVKRDDVVVFLCPPTALSIEERKEGVKKDFIKRAIGLPGDVLQIKEKQVYINGQKLADGHAHFLTHSTYNVSIPSLKSQTEYQEIWQNGGFADARPEFIRDNFGPVKIPEKCYFVMGDNRDGSFDSRFWGPLDEKFVKGRAWLVYWPFSRFGLIR